jgi:hypothetical protein
LIAISDYCRFHFHFHTPLLIIADILPLAATAIRFHAFMPLLAADAADITPLAITLIIAIR